MPYKANITLKPNNSTNTKSFDVLDFTFDVEQTLNIGSQSTGAGAGKITFNPMKITRVVDQNTPELFLNAASGTPYETAIVTFPQGPDVTFTFKLVAVKTITYGFADPDALNRFEQNFLEEVTFEYGGLQVKVGKTQQGWDRVKNVKL